MEKQALRRHDYLHRQQSGNGFCHAPCHSGSAFTLLPHPPQRRFQRFAEVPFYSPFTSIHDLFHHLRPWILLHWYPRLWKPYFRPYDSFRDLAGRCVSFAFIPPRRSGNQDRTNAQPCPCTANIRVCFSVRRQQSTSCPCSISTGCEPVR